ncbi:MAG TPA: DUF2062 domain-containing protein [Candidatus Accumulibacter phosphatis]|nr:MAG: hypothetical protein AW07_02450 [Candidatus Accumulibacter sp. SK-11]HAY29142.1 DUF2062 domain-containing protein [Accumulibacter sp.]HRL75640.1 DUF2062 domain-containing protein [Candidatus Accumulibacter phosphatis]HCN66737.1 DUF2062 domain-containing protein [Accumulibacter sp.]HCV12173.1 DUF2062 domain-containing protein [Accumulibacter sp.]
MSAVIQRLRALAPTREQLEANPWLRGLAPYLANPKLWHWSRRGVAMGVAIGLFIGFLIPVAQILLAAAAAVFLRANVPVAAAGTLVTNPLTVPPIYYAAYHLGAWATGTSATTAISVADPTGFWENLGSIGMPLFTGLAMTASFAAVASYLLISQAWIWHVSAKRRGARP